MVEDYVPAPIQNQFTFWRDWAVALAFRERASSERVEAGLEMLSGATGSIAASERRETLGQRVPQPCQTSMICWELSWVASRLRLFCKTAAA